MFTSNHILGFEDPFLFFINSLDYHLFLTGFKAVMINHFDAPGIEMWDNTLFLVNNGLFTFNDIALLDLNKGSGDLTQLEINSILVAFALYLFLAKIGPRVSKIPSDLISDLKMHTIKSARFLSPSTEIITFDIIDLAVNPIFLEFLLTLLRDTLSANTLSLIINFVKIRRCLFRARSDIRIQRYSCNLFLDCYLGNLVLCHLDKFIFDFKLGFDSNKKIASSFKNPRYRSLNNKLVKAKLINDTKLISELELALNSTPRTVPNPNFKILHYARIFNSLFLSITGRQLEVNDFIFSLNRYFLENWGFSCILNLHLANKIEPAHFFHGDYYWKAPKFVGFPKEYYFVRDRGPIGIVFKLRCKSLDSGGKIGSIV